MEGRLDFRDAAAICRATARTGETVRRLIDCLIAAVAVRAGAVLLHKDGDFDVIARHVPLPVVSCVEPAE